jgi:hypothetical protein
VERLFVGFVAAHWACVPRAALPLDTKPDPTKAKIHKIIEPEEIFKKTGYSRPHTVHCGPEGIYVSTLGGGGKDGTDGPPGVFIMDCETFDVLGRWEIDRGPQTLHYDFWWNLPRDYMVSSEWALPPQFENGIVPEDLLSNKYGAKEREPREHTGRRLRELTEEGILEVQYRKGHAFYRVAQKPAQIGGRNSAPRGGTILGTELR